jgi:hypothetical protein
VRPAKAPLVLTPRLGPVPLAPPAPSPAVHLIDFYVATRNKDRNLVHDYERNVPKDVVQLDPGAEIAVIAR